MSSEIGGMNARDKNENNSDNRSSTLECECGSETGFVIVKAKHVVVMEDPMRLLCSSAGMNTSALIISYVCKHCNCGKPVQITYEYVRDGVRVTEGYFPDYANAYKRSIQVQPLPYAQVAAIKDGMKWPAAEYNAVTRNSQHWVREFVQKIQNATAEGVPDPPFKIVEADIVIGIAKPGAGRAKSEGCTKKVKFWNKDFDTDVTVKQMADKALQQTDLKAKGYRWYGVRQRKELPNGGIEYEKADFDDPILHGAFYRVPLTWKEPNFEVSVNVITLDEEGKRKILRRYSKLEFWKKKVTVSQMATKALEESDKTKGCIIRKVKQRKVSAEGYGFYEEVDLDAPIEHHAYYQVWVVRKQKKIVDATIVKPGQQHVDEQPTTSNKAPIQQPSATESMQKNDLLDDEPNTGRDHDNQKGAAALRNLEENQAFNEGNISLDLPMANCTIKQEIPDEIAKEVKQELLEPSEFDELIALQEQQPSTSTSTTVTAPPPAKKSRVQQKPPSSKRKKK